MADNAERFVGSRRIVPPSAPGNHPAQRDGLDPSQIGLLSCFLRAHEGQWGQLWGQRGITGEFRFAMHTIRSPGQPINSGPQPFWRRRRVDGAGDFELAVPKQVLNVSQVCTVCLGVGGETVAQIIEPLARNPSRLACSVERLQYVLTDTVCEHEIQILPFRPGEQPCLVARKALSA